MTEARSVESLTVFLGRRSVLSFLIKTATFTFWSGQELGGVLLSEQTCGLMVRNDLSAETLAVAAFKKLERGFSTRSDPMPNINITKNMLVRTINLLSSI